eukprot:GHUV01014158.1.p1 GENE.GHUV01014158.1~~GHUV01014158.1.p1  ORF type:complete len:511 (+),score=158.79 GHUV01014158.1:164-1696(+)
MCQLLHLPNLSPPPLSMRQLLQKTSESMDSNHESSAGAASVEPVLFVTTPGADPSQELAAFAETQVGRDRLHEVAMGQGQAEVALQLLKECTRTGDWLLLKNLHLVVSWLPLLEKEVHNLPPDRHEGFRLFLTSEPHGKFPATLLESSLKVVFEAPPGIKMNLQHTYASWSTDFLAGTTAAATGTGTVQPVPAQLVPLRAQLLFLLAWFNAVIQERRNYVPYGWSTAYDFSVADLRAGADVVSRIASSTDQSGMDWQQLLGLLQVIYGGRVDAEHDARVLVAHLKAIFTLDLLTARPPTTTGRRQQQQQRLPGLSQTATPLPLTGAKQDWQAYVATLPDTDAPEVFGLPANIERAVALGSSKRLLAALRQMGTAQAAAAAFDRQVWADQLQPLLKLWDQLVSTAPPGLRQVIAAASSAVARPASAAARAAAVAAAAVAANPGGPASRDVAATSSASAGGSDGPVESFVGLERQFGMALLKQIAGVMGGIKAVVTGDASLSASVQAAASAS